MKTKIIVITGPTATGKSDLAVTIARQYNGEIISADSRQVYVGMNIGTGKITKEEMKGVPHHLLDIASPNTRYTVSEWTTSAKKIIQEITARGKLPIICGGTGFYISSLVNGTTYPEITTNKEVQEKLESKSAEELFEELQKLDPRRAKEIDPKNKRRVSRAILIARELGSVPPIETKESEYDTLYIGTLFSDKEIQERIHKRLVSRIENGMLEEAKRLHQEGMSFERMEELGLEYRYEAMYLQNKISKEEMIETLYHKIWQYAKRQKTWWKQNKEIKWFSPKDLENIALEVEKFLKNC